MLRILGENGENPRVTVEAQPNGKHTITLRDVGDFLCLPSGTDPCPEYEEDGKQASGF